MTTNKAKIGWVIKYPHMSADGNLKMTIEISGELCPENIDMMNQIAMEIKTKQQFGVIATNSVVYEKEEVLPSEYEAWLRFKYPLTAGNSSSPN